MLRQLLVLGALSTLCAPAADLPVREVILYKHGVGFFQRSGQLAAGETARLDFKAEDMNDVLKSLTLTDRAGGKISGVRYDASEPLDERSEGRFRVRVEYDRTRRARRDEASTAAAS